jgi:hypothetical protein
MSIPLDRLYLYLEQVAQEQFGDDIIIYRFSPNGSKKIEDLRPFTPKTFKENTVQPEIFCNDQEPLNYQLYQNQPNWHKGDPKCNANLDAILEQHGHNFPNFNFRGQIRNVWDNALLVHSERRSSHVALYQQTQFISIYYWCHAVIARDWFRYAEHVNQKKQIDKTFLIYNRAWSGTREYRLRFAELLIHLNLQELCKTSVNPIEPELGIHYEIHKFKNPVWRPQTVLENYFPVSNAHSHYSAIFDIKDYESTDIEVVLETLFDDDRLHLTEKSLRPIACAQPFILAGTHGSLEYLRSYGFKTFSDVWDESYNLVEDPSERLIQIAELMKYISTWLPHQREHNMSKARAIAEYNKQHFFSKEFFDQIIGELKTNFSQAFEQMKSSNTGKPYFKRLGAFQSIPELKPHVATFTTDEEAAETVALAKNILSKYGK